MGSPAINHDLLHPTTSRFFTEDGGMPSLDDVPTFLKQGLDMNKVKQTVTEPETEQDRNSIAKVSSNDPYNIKVLSPDLYGSSVQHHELTHTYQETRNKSLPPVAKDVPNTGHAAYDYGGITGLQTARQQKKTIADFNYEQQAEIVKDYKALHDSYLKKAATGKMPPAEEKQMYDLQQTYHPFIKQLADMPGQKENLDRSPLLELLGIQKPSALSKQPEAPGLPSYETPGLGVVSADKLMGGKSQETPKIDKSKLHLKAQKFFLE